MAIQVMIGELGPGDCIGEVILRGTNVQPYTIISATAQTRIGWIDSLSIRGECNFMSIGVQKQLYLSTTCSTDNYYPVMSMCVSIVMWMPCSE